MKVFLAGATGAIGRPLVGYLRRAGHEVIGMTRTPSKAVELVELGAEPVVCDVYDAEALKAHVVAAQPDVVMHQLTDLPDALDDLPAFALRNARIRREGTANLLAAAAAAGVQRFLAQSVAWQIQGEGGAAVAEHEAAVLAAGGVVLRYGTFYGPDTFNGDTPPPAPRVHVDEAARRTVEALLLPSSIVTIVEAAGHEPA